MSKYLCLLVVLGVNILLISPSALASPTGGECHRVILIGEAEDSFFCILARYNMPGSYYHHTELVYLIEIGLSSGDTLSITQLREAIYRTDVNTLEPSIEELGWESLDLGEILSTRKISIPLLSRLRGDPHIRDGTIHLRREGESVAIAPTMAMAVRLSTLELDPTVVGIFSTKTHQYHVIQSSPQVDGCGDNHDIVVIPNEVYQDAESAMTLLVKLKKGKYSAVRLTRYGIHHRPARGLVG